MYKLIYLYIYIYIYAWHAAIILQYPKYLHQRSTTYSWDFLMSSNTSMLRGSMIAFQDFKAAASPTPSAICSNSSTDKQ